MMIRFRVCDSFTLSFIRTWFELIDDYQIFTKTRLFSSFHLWSDFAKSLFPGYFLLLRTLLPLVQKSMVLQYNVGVSRRKGLAPATELAQSAAKCCNCVIEEEWMLGSFVEMAMRFCNLFIYSDIMHCKNRGDFSRSFPIFGFLAFYAETASLREFAHSRDSASIGGNHGASFPPTIVPSSGTVSRHRR